MRRFLAAALYVVAMAPFALAVACFWLAERLDPSFSTDEPVLTPTYRRNTELT